MTDTDQTEDPMRAFAQALFARAGDDETDETEEDPKPPGHVPNEGRVIEPPADDPMRKYVRDLFGDDLNFRNT